MNFMFCKIKNLKKTSNDSCVGFSIYGTSDSRVDYVKFSDSNCMAQNSGYDFSSTTFKKLPTQCDDANLQLMLSNLRFVTSETVTLDNPYTVSVSIGQIPTFPIGT